MTDTCESCGHGPHEDNWCTVRWFGPGNRPEVCDCGYYVPREREVSS